MSESCNCWYLPLVHLTHFPFSQDPSVRQPILPLLGWDKFPSVDVPSLFNWGHAHVYLVETAPNWEELTDLSPEDVDELNALSQDISDAVGRTDLARKGIRFLDSHHVTELFDVQTEEFYFVKARVQASMKSGVYFATVTIRVASGSVRACTCSCSLRSLGRCSHVASLLMFITRHVEVNGYGGEYRSIPCMSYS